MPKKKGTNLLGDVFEYCCWKWYGNYGLKNVVNTHIYNIYNVKNVLSTIFLIMSFQKWKNIFVCLVCLGFLFFFIKVMTYSLISETYILKIFIKMLLSNVV